MTSAVHAQEPGTVLREVEKRLKPAFAGLKPAPSVQYPEPSYSLEVRYRPQEFLVHERSRSGDWSTNVVKRIGPSSTGFILWICVEPLGEENQAVVPQTIQEPYWKTDLRVTPVARTTNQIYWALSYSGRADEKLLARVTQTLASLAPHEPIKRAEPNGPANAASPHR